MISTEKLAQTGDRNIKDPLLRYLKIRAQIAKILDDLKKPPRL